MSITKSYNKHTNTYYAYDTTYVWDDQLQKKVQKKTCIGKYDPNTGEIIPNSRRGRPSKNIDKTVYDAENNAISDKMISCNGFSQEIKEVLSEIHDIKSDLFMLTKKLETLENKLIALQNNI